MQESGSIIAEEHTLHYLKDGELLDCSLDQWGSLEKWEKDGKPDLLDKAHKKVEQILANHTITPFERSVQREIEKAQEAF
jgi:trimethylamine:corrinoid methyltransferase-like protein